MRTIFANCIFKLLFTRPTLDRTVALFPCGSVITINPSWHPSQAISLDYVLDPKPRLYALLPTPPSYGQPQIHGFLTPAGMLLVRSGAGVLVRSTHTARLIALDIPTQMDVHECAKELLRHLEVLAQPFEFAIPTTVEDAKLQQK